MTSISIQLTKINMADKYTDSWDKFWKMFNSFGADFGSDDFSMKSTTPEEFMKEGEYTKTTETGTDKKSGEKFTKETFVSKDGKRKFTRTTIDGRSMQNKSRTVDNRPRTKLYTLEEVEMELKKAVENQEFENAAKLRDAIAKFKKKKV